jgi:serine/threonine protein kinase
VTGVAKGEKSPETRGGEGGTRSGVSVRCEEMGVETPLEGVDGLDAPPASAPRSTPESTERTQSQSVPLALPGEIISGKFRVESIIGEGGMGVVVSATHLQLRELVAMKFLHREAMNNPQVVARFAHEARAAAKLKSEHIARVLDVGVREDGVPYMVMEHLEGKDLRNVIDTRGCLPVAVAVEYIVQACDGLAEAHARGIVHRDIKPENLFLVERDGWHCVKVLDFGISKAALTGVSTPEELALLETSTIMGSPCYMAPEQIHSTSRVDHRADLWSLGAVLFELLTGVTPFDSEQTLHELMRAILDQPPRGLLDLRPDAPASLDAVIQCCLHKDRDKRYQNAAELAIALLPFAPRRARVPAERAVSVTRSAGLGSEKLSMPVSVFPFAAPLAEVSIAELRPARVPKFEEEARAPSTPSGPVSAGRDTVVATTTSQRAARFMSSPSRAPTSRFAIAGGAFASFLLGGFVAMRQLGTEPAPLKVAAAPQIVQVRVTSTPDGASVKEDGVEVCASTPCVVTYQGEAASPTAVHALTIAKAGFLSETRSIETTRDPTEPLTVPLAASAKKEDAAVDQSPTVRDPSDLPY